MRLKSMCARRAPMSAQRRAPTIFQPSGMGLNVRRVGRKLTVQLQRDRLHVGDDLRHNFGTIYLVCLPHSLTTSSFRSRPDQSSVNPTNKSSMVCTRTSCPSSSPVVYNSACTTVCPNQFYSLQKNNCKSLAFPENACIVAQRPHQFSSARLALIVVRAHVLGTSLPAGV